MFSRSSKNPACVAGIAVRESPERPWGWSGRRAHPKGTAAQRRPPEHPVQSRERGQSGTPSKKPMAHRQVLGPPSSLELIHSCILQP